MDLTRRNEKYQEYLKKIKVVGQDTNDRMFLKNIKQKAEQSLEDLTTDNDSSTYTTVMILLLVPLVLLILGAMIRYGGYVHIIPLLLLGAYIVYFRLKMIQVTKEATMHRPEESIDEKDQYGSIKQKLTYVMYGVRIKRTRVELVKYLYIIFFPILMYYVFLQINNSPAFSSHWIALLIAYILGGFVWNIFFADDINGFEDLEYGFQSDLNELMLK